MKQKLTIILVAVSLLLISLPAMGSPGIPDIVQHTSIAYSLDEKRAAFKPSVNLKAKTAAFRGGHSDVGGGYFERGLANISLEWMTDQAIAAGAPFIYPGRSGSGDMVRHQESKWYFWTANRNNAYGVPLHPSVLRLISEPIQKVNNFRHTTDLTPYHYYVDTIAPGNDEYQVGEHKF